MRKNKIDREVKSQIHFYSEEKLYNEFKEAIKEYNSENKDNLTISEALRFFIYQFANGYTMQSGFKDMLCQFRNDNKRGVSNGKN